MNRRVAASDAGLALPGEERIMKAFSKSMKKLRGEEQRNPFKLTGILASIASGGCAILFGETVNARNNGIDVTG